MFCNYISINPLYMYYNRETIDSSKQGEIPAKNSSIKMKLNKMKYLNYTRKILKTR